MKYPIGSQNFEILRKSDFVYIDKTGLIYKLVDENRFVFLARPRRFGKSLLLSTLQAYFEGKKELFKGLAIENIEKEWNNYPVFHLEFSKVNNSSHSDLIEEVQRQIADLERKYEIPELDMNLGSRFANLIKTVSEKTGKQVVILIDEYDSPLINTLHDEKLHEQNRSLLKSVYSNLKGLDAYIQFAILTGVSRFSKMEIFSGLNNLYDITFDNAYSTICGFTETEILNYLGEGINQLASHENISKQEAVELLKKNYDGYHFTISSPDIYNPFSLLSALHKKEFGSFWFLTATPSFLVERLYVLGVNLSSLLNSEVSPTMLASADASHSSPIALLFQTGYLTIKGYEKEWDAYKLGIPNLEVKKGLFEEMSNIFQHKDSSDILPLLRKITCSLKEGNPEEFLLALKSYLATIPASLTQKSSELYFENNIYIILTLLGIYCRTEVSISKGRIDVEIQTENYIYILELKLDKSVEEALKQIEEKSYALPYEHLDKTVFKIGINFSSETRNITKWVINIRLYKP